MIDVSGWPCHPHHITFTPFDLRVFERGVGETLACGTGACAAAVSGMRRGLLSNSVEIELAGGKLQIEWREGDVVWMTGPTANVYHGRLDLNYFQG